MADLLEMGLRIIRKIHQSIPIVDFELQRDQRGKSQDARDFRSGDFTDRCHVEREDILVLLPEVPERQYRFVSIVNLLNGTADSGKGRVWISTHLGDLASCRWVDHVGCGASVDEKQPRGTASDAGWD